MTLILNLNLNVSLHLTGPGGGAGRAAQRDPVTRKGAARAAAGRPAAAHAPGRTASHHVDPGGRGRGQSLGVPSLCAQPADAACEAQAGTPGLHCLVSHVCHIVDTRCVLSVYRPVTLQSLSAS